MKVIPNQEQWRFPKGNKEEHLVYCYYQQGRICIARRYPEMPELPQNKTFAVIQQLSAKVWKQLPMRVKKEFCRYARYYKRHYFRIRRQHCNGFGIFNKVFHRAEKEFALSNYNDQVYQTFLTFFGSLSIRDYMLNGYLPFMPSARKLTASVIQTAVILPMILCPENEGLIGRDRTYLIEDQSVP